MNGLSTARRTSQVRQRLKPACTHIEVWTTKVLLSDRGC
jgi:hypothetical protein